MSIHTTMRCNKCGTTISEISPHWTATYSERNDPESTIRHPTRVDICTECVQEVLGELIRDARGEEPQPLHGGVSTSVPRYTRGGGAGTCPVVIARPDPVDHGELYTSTCGNLRPCPIHDAPPQVTFGTNF